MLHATGETMQAEPVGGAVAGAAGGGGGGEVLRRQLAEGVGGAGFGYGGRDLPDAAALGAVLATGGRFAEGVAGEAVLAS